MKPFTGNTAAAAATALIFSSCFTPAVYALGKDDPRQKDSIGTYTVKCQVHKNSPGNPVVGFVFGNNDKKPELAEKDADLFVSRFGPNHAKRHCRTQKRYSARGAFTTSMQPV